MEYELVPSNVYTSKDLNYLCDMFCWHYNAYKKTINRIDNVVDEEVILIMKKSCDIFYNHMKTILDILNEGGQDE